MQAARRRGMGARDRRGSFRMRLAEITETGPGLGAPSASAMLAAP